MAGTKFIAVLLTMMVAFAAGAVVIHLATPQLTDTASTEAAAPQMTIRPSIRPTTPRRSGETATPAPKQRGVTIPSFDVVRVEKGGDGVVAGRAEPDWRVILEAGERAIAEVTADSVGEWVAVLDKPLPPGEHALGLRAYAPDGSRGIVSDQTVVVSVAKPQEGGTVVALAEPGKATRVLQREQKTPALSADTPAASAARTPQSQPSSSGPTPSQPSAAAEPTATASAPAATAAAPSTPVKPSEPSAGAPAAPAAPEQQTAARPSETIPPQGAEQPAAGAAAPATPATSAAEPAERGARPSEPIPSPPASGTPAATPPATPQATQTAEAPAAGSGQTGQPAAPMAEPGKATPETQVAAASPKPEPAPTGKRVIQALPAGEKPSETPAAGTAATPQKPKAKEPKQQVAFSAVDYEHGPDGKIFMSGQAEPGAEIYIYLNNEHIGRATAGPDGRWTFDRPTTLDPGSHTMRADQVLAGGQVTSRAEVMFERLPPKQLAVTEKAQPQSAGAGAPSASSPAPAEQKVAAAQGTAPPSPPVAAPAAAPAVKPRPRTRRSTSRRRHVVVRRGDSLWRIARRHYGHGWKYTKIYRSNRSQIRNPHLIYPRQKFRLPRR